MQAMNIFTYPEGAPFWRRVLSAAAWVGAAAGAGVLYILLAGGR